MNTDEEFYSQNGEDFLLWNLFNQRPNGFYIDIGAFDGIYLSNSCFFDRQGWDGVCVEAHPRYFELCHTNRPRAHCLHRACTGSTSQETVIFHAEELGLFSGILTEPEKAVESRYARRNMKFSGYQTTEVGTVSLNEIVDQFTSPGAAIDFISIDTEGTEIEILKDFDFSKRAVQVFIVEANDDSSARGLIQLMQSKGYTLARILQRNLFFAKSPETINFLKFKPVRCKIADAIHPMGDQATRSNERGRLIEDSSRWITSNVLSQLPEQPFWSLIDFFPEEPANEPDSEFGILHVINPYPADAHSWSGKQQYATYRSMEAAKTFYDGKIKLISIQHRDDPDLTPSGFQRGSDLDRTVQDVRQFVHPQPLPLLFDILERGAELAGPDDYIVYTNSDINLMPHFYSAVRDLINSGFDAINICRRTIGGHTRYYERSNLARCDIGSYHPGSDCFIFSRRMFEQFVRNDCCIGKLGMPQSLLCNMAACADRMLVIRNAHLTFHIGDERSWADGKSMEYQAFNDREFEKTRAGLSRDPVKASRLKDFINAYWQQSNLFGQVGRPVTR